MAAPRVCSDAAQRKKKKKFDSNEKTRWRFRKARCSSLQQRINALEPTLLSEKETQEHFQRVMGAQGNFTKLKDLVEQKGKS